MKENSNELRIFGFSKHLFPDYNLTFFVRNVSNPKDTDGKEYGFKISTYDSLKNMIEFVEVLEKNWKFTCKETCKSCRQTFS